MDAFSKSPSPRQVPRALRGHVRVLGAADLFVIVERLIGQILADLKAYGITFNYPADGQCHLNRASVRDTLRHEIARALDGERVQLMVMHHAWDAEPVVTSVDEWLERWPQHMGLYVDVNRYLNDIVIVK